MEMSMERKAFPSTDLSNPLQETRGDFNHYPTHPHPFPHYTLREPAPAPYQGHPLPPGYKARSRDAKKAAKPGGKKRWRTGWQAQLQSIIDEHNWRHASKNKGVSFKTMHDRATFLFSCFRMLRAANPPFKPQPRNLGNRHITHLVGQWVERGLSAGTLRVYLCYLRTFCEWTNHPGMVLPLERYLSDPALAKRTYAAKEDKSWIAHRIVPEEKIAEIRRYDLRAACWFRNCLAYAARLKEVLMMLPHQAEVDGKLFLTSDGRAMKYETYLELKRGTKGGRVRFVPIDTPEKRAALEEAKQLVKSETGHLGDPTKSLRQNMRRFKHVCDKFGITKAKLGVTLHGLRHQYAVERYEKFSGTPAPVRGGAPVAREVDRAARLQVAEELGHSRENITRAYLGGILKSPAKAEEARDGSEASSPEPVADPRASEERKDPR
jgi:integrase